MFIEGDYEGHPPHIGRTDALLSSTEQKIMLNDQKEVISQTAA